MPDTVEKVLSGADSRITVSVLNPDDWFVPQGRPPTEGNRVTALVDGRRAMAEMARAFEGSTYVYLTGWEVDDDVSLLRARGFTGHRLADVLGRAAAGGSRVRVLLWAGATFVASSRPDPSDPTKRMDIDDSNALTAANLRRAGAQVVLDDRGQTFLGAALTSHHQKSAIADGGSEGAVGFCGGIDIARERWDFPEHPAFDSRRDPAAGVAFATTLPWHDVHAMVRGPAVGALEANFADRWNEHGTGETIIPNVHLAVVAGTHLVQVVRTIGAGNYAFVRDGEFGILAAYLIAVDRAQRYVYMENQCFVSEILTDALIEAMRRNANAGRDFRIILVLPHKPAEADGSGGSSGSGNAGKAILFHQRDMIRRLKAADPGGVFHVYYLHQPLGERDIFVHAKVAIVDDVWATIGSASLNRPGFCFDSEINLVVVDTEVADGGRRFARDLRLELWQEHLRLDPGALGTITDPIAGAGVWTARAGSAQSHVRVFDEDENPGEDSYFWDFLIDDCDDSVPEREAGS